ncbi:hypothetical protein F2P56_026023 [Juglans regia]|uniref:Stemmadenine O-acetyltransferase-like n=2 Tax=Juglans regia TaxID=51240 RepID=A0A833ULD8_JUGRE|nr:acetyl-CoA-benzylalcohol acetyltransferase-like [Juglans regia]KAF5456553.1 hypothetical protein F2P56_026023 [Juglans regia]
MNMKVQILSKKFIKPANPTPPHLRSLQISSIDQLSPPTHVPSVLYYPANGYENDKTRKLLEKSLSEILTLYYPLAGRYIKERQLIDCNDQGVEYLEAQVDGKLAQLLTGEVNMELLTNFIPYGILESATTPLIIVQVNMFNCGGLAVGIRCAHRITDGFTGTAFFNSWATACRVGGIDDISHPIFDLASFFPPRENVPAALHQTYRRADITRRFVFNKAAVASLKATAKGVDACDSTTPKRQPSRVAVVTALLWKALIGVSQARHGRSRPSILSHLVNMRGKTALPISENSSGNLCRNAFARFGGESCDKKLIELHALVGLVNDAMRDAVASCLKPKNGNDLCSMVSDSLREVCEEYEKGETDVYMFFSWCRLPFYETDFGWGKPIWVSTTRVPVEIVYLVDTKDGDGVEAWMHLDEKNMLLFQDHPDIIAFASQT